MTKAEIIARLKETRAHMEKLKPEQFNYSNWVTKFDLVNNCGTICCIAGWYPRWYPDNFQYEGFQVVGTINHDRTFFGILGSLVRFHQIHTGLIKGLFLGAEVYAINFRIGLKNGVNSKLNEVNRFWDEVIELLETTNALDKYLIISEP